MYLIKSTQVNDPKRRGRMINANIGRDRPFDAYSIQILPPIEDWQRAAKQIDVQVGGYCYL